MLRSLSFDSETKSTDQLLHNNTPDQVSADFGRVCSKLGIHDFHFHDLRHTAASWLQMEGADTHNVAQLPGQKDLRMAARYLHLIPAFLADRYSETYTA